jgi:predicted trehalose synthase
MFSCTFDLKINDMIIERTSDQIIIKVSPKVDSFGFQRIMDYLDYLEITAKSQATQEDADKLADELNENWWSKNRQKFIK